MSRAGRRRGWRKHEGVALVCRTLPSGVARWLARYRDPDSGKTKHETVPPTLTTDEQRAAWAAAKARALKSRDEQIAGGAPTKKNVSLADAIERYYRDVPNLRPATLKVYRAATDTMLAWASHERIELADDIRSESLASLKSWLINKPGFRQASGGRVKTGRARGVYSVNRDVRGIKAALEHLRRHGLLPFISHDAIRDNMKTLPTPKPVPAYLKPSALTKLIQAAQRHDAEVFDLTRDEKMRGVEGGSTPRHAPVLPYIALLLLSGMRADEGRLLLWESVDLDAMPAGSITLRPEGVKTKHGRVVDLVVSPVLSELLVSLRLTAGATIHVFRDGQDESGNLTCSLTRFIVEAARKRLVREFGAPRFTWKQLRVTCGTFLANAPGIFGAASAYREARQLGHSVAVAERHYLGVVHVDPGARTLEAAMGIDGPLRKALGLTTTQVGRGEQQSRG